MPENDMMQILRETGAWREGHFMMTSGRHATGSLQCARLFERPDKMRLVAQELRARLGDIQVDLVLGPALGGIIPAYEMASLLGVKGIFCEKEQGSLRLRRGYTIPEGSRVLVAEDVITTGGSLRQVERLVRDNGAQIVAVCAVADLSMGRYSLAAPLFAACTIQMTSYPVDECPLCRDGVPLEKPASRSI